jgi:hypothetical protein
MDVLCEKAEYLNKELGKNNKRIFNNFLIQCRSVSDHFEKSISQEDCETSKSMIDIKYNLMLEMKKQWDKQK